MKKRLLAILLIVCMVASLLPVTAMAASEETAESKASDTVSSVKVRIMAQKEGKFLFAPLELREVRSDVAENYGYTDKVRNGVSLIDVLVQAHVIYYGYLFSKETASDYLVVNANGEPVKTFGCGETAFSSDYAVNGVIPNNGAYECGDNIDFTHLYDTKVRDNDTIEFFTFQDTENQNDEYCWFVKDGKAISVLSIEPNQEVTLQVKGINFLKQATQFADAASMKALGSPISGVKVGIYDPKTNTVTEKWTADENGSFKLSFEKATSYYITVYGTDTNGTPVIMAPMKVEVSPISLYPTPKSISIVPDESIVDHASKYGSSVNHYALITPTDNTLTFKAVDQDGKETPVTWSSSSTSLVFEQPRSGSALLVNNSTSAQGTTVTATSYLDEEVTATYYVYVVPQISTDKEKNVTLDRDGKKPNYPPSLTVYPREYADMGRLEWVIADPDVLTLTGKDDSNYRSMYGGRPGTTTVTVRDSMNHENFAEATINVSGVYVTDANGVSERTMTYIGDTMQLKAYAAEPESKLEWYSMDESIATVDENGLVTGVKNGVVVIHAEDEAENIGGITVAVGKDAKGVYLDDLLLCGASSYYKDEMYKSYLPSSSYYYNDSYAASGYAFNGVAGADETFYLKAGNSAFQMKLRPYYDDVRMRVEYYLDGELLGSGAVNTEYAITIPSGASKVVVRAVDLTNEKNYTDYTFNLVKARSANGTVSATSFSPDNRNLKDGMTLHGFGEGTTFQLDEDGNIIIPSSTWSKPWSPNKYSYKAFLYGDVESFKTTFTAGDSYSGHLAYSVDGENYIEGIGELSTKSISFPESNVVNITIKAVSDEVYYNCKQADTDPWADESVCTYNVSVERLSSEDTGDLIIKSLKIEGDYTMVTPGFSPDRLSCGALVPMDKDSTTIVIDVPEGIEVNVPTSSYGLHAQTIKNEDGTYTIIAETKMASYGNDKEVKIELSKTLENGSVLKATYVVNLYKVGKLDGYGSSAQPVAQYGLPDGVADYLCIGSQSTNDLWNSTYDQIGINPERTLVGTGGWALQIALGSFGGYVTYYYKDAITNDESHPYGIDFTVISRAYGEASSKRPGTVWVSEDGETWYELAGSEHYDANAVWNYEVTYTRNERGNLDFTDNHGRKGSFTTAAYEYQYPMEDYYPLHKWTEAEKNGSMSFSGTLLLGQNGMDFSQTDAYAANPAWGYASVGTPGSLSIDANGNYSLPHVNPYGSDSTVNGGDAFDLSWAVDKYGDPVELNAVHYVKVQGASMILATSTTTEKSTRINSVSKTCDSGNSVGVTAAPEAISVNGTALQLKDGVYSYKAWAGEEFKVEVTAGENANVYINNLRASERSYDAANPFDFDKGIIRIVVQEGEAAPVIYYIHVDNELDLAKANAKAELEAYKDPANYTDQQKEELAAAVAAGKKAIDDAATVEEVGKALEAAKAAIDGIKDPFTDIASSGYYNEIVAAAKFGLINGYDDGTYRPNMEVTRGQFITIMWRAVGSPEAKDNELKFTDADSIYSGYKAAIAWGVENGVIEGYADNTFRPDQKISRAQMATFMYRYLKNVESYDFGDVSSVSFTDADQIANAYKDAVNAIVSAGIMNGFSKTTFAPNSTATRGQAAAVLLRMYNILNAG